MRWCLGLVLLVACACPSKQAGTGTGTGTASGSGGVTAERPPTATPTSPTGCDGVRAKVEQLYRADAQVTEPKRVEEAVADNTAMVMADCATAPARISSCLSLATSVADLETHCLSRFDAEGNPVTHEVYR